MPSPFFNTPGPLGLIRALLGTSNGSDIDAGFAAMATDIENKMVNYSSGATLPVVVPDGAIFRQTTTGLRFIGDGVQWIPLIADAGSVQNGVLASGDLAVSGIGVNGSTGAISVTVAAASAPAMVLSSSGLLVPTTFAGGAVSLIPGTLPASGHSLAVGLEMDPTGAFSLVCGAPASGNLAITAVTSPAVTSGRLRVWDFALANVSGTYQLGSTSTPTQGTNHRDRRPHARGAAWSSTSSSVSARIECTGQPMLVTIDCMDQGLSSIGSGASAAATLTVDGVTIVTDSLSSSTSTTGSSSGASVSETILYTPTAGSHLFTFTATIDGAGPGGSVTVFEMVRSVWQNGTI